MRFAQTQASIIASTVNLFLKKRWFRCRIKAIRIMSCYSKSTLFAATKTVTKVGSGTVTSAPVGLATSASFTASCNTTSSGKMTANCLAAWSGWPFSTEGSMTLKPGQSNTLNDTQRELSSFKIQLTGAGTGSGSVSCNWYVVCRRWRHRRHLL